VPELTVGSLFAGIGGLDLGLERAGMTVIWQSEIDPYASRVLAKHWPTVPNLGDIKTIDWSTVERPDLICGGYPCQPFSYAGNRQGDDDPRHLWPHALTAIRHLRPRYVLLENVPGHLSLGFGRVLGDLASIGYDAEWDCFPAAYVGAPHLRYRVFIVAWPASDRVPDAVGDDVRVVAQRDQGGGTIVGAAVVGDDGPQRLVADPDDERLQGGDDPGGGEGLAEAGREPARSGAAGDGGSVADPERGGFVGAGGDDGEHTAAWWGRVAALVEWEPGEGSASDGVLADPAGGRRPQRDEGEWEPSLTDAVGDVPDTEGTGLEGRGLEPAGGAVAAADDWWVVEPDVGRVAHGVPNRVDRLRTLGNAVVPQVAELIGRRIMEAAG
jgi:DNA (cytosine-5)-methyltransferase 1